MLDFVVCPTDLISIVRFFMILFELLKLLDFICRQP